MATFKTIVVAYDVYECFAMYIEYGDIEGLEEHEVEAFDALTAKVRADAPAGYEFMHWANEVSEGDFGFCEVIDTFCTRTRINAVYREAPSWEAAYPTT